MSGLIEAAAEALRREDGCYVMPQPYQRNDARVVLESVRTFLLADKHNPHIVATSISIRQAAGETPSDYVRRIVGAYLDEAMS